MSFKTIQVDNGLEFSMKEYFQSYVIEYQRTYVHTPQQNGVVECKHCHILTIACVQSSFQSQLPLTFWGECVLTIIYLINHLPSQVLSTKSSFEIHYHQFPSLDHLRVFGCLCHATNV